jgi:AraC-like DNA-binding protein
VIEDADLARRLNHLHHLLEDPSGSLLEHQSRLLMALAHLITRYADDPPPLGQTGAESDPIRQVRDFIDDQFRHNIALDDLVAVAHLSPFYLVRVFTKEVGLPPHAYLTQRRVMAACRLLRVGVSPAQAAVEVGFVDQSHLHRHFKRIMGLTPGLYQSH